MEREDTQTQAAYIFLRAAAYIRQYGWQEKGMSAHGKPRCSMGALASAHPVKRWDEDMAILMYEALTNYLKDTSLTAFNSKAGSGEKIARLYEQVAASLLASNVTFSGRTAYAQPV